jgi:hypothetical protein
MSLLRHGHAPGHVRDAALEAFQAWIDWNGKGAEPTVAYEMNYEPHQIPISQACKLVYNCTDIVPGSTVDQLLDEGLEFKTRTYAGCARAILEALKTRQVA